jgi:hypothetical protein
VKLESSLQLGLGVFDWSGSASVSDVWFEYTDAYIPVYDLTTVSDMVKNIYVHLRSALNHPFLASIRGLEGVVFGSESNRRVPHTMFKSNGSVCE